MRFQFNCELKLFKGKVYAIGLIDLTLGDVEVVIWVRIVQM